MKKHTALILIISALILSGCQRKTSPKNPSDDQNDSGARLVINQLDQAKRPFVLLSQHQTGKFLNFFISHTSNVDQATVDLEYLSGDLLKGARSTIDEPISDPYVRAFLLGSCSAGGKCSFDENLISGSLKLKLEIKDESDTHLLKGDYSFVNGETTSVDGRITYIPDGNSTGQIIINTLGLPKNTSSIQSELYPIAITSLSPGPIKGKLIIKKKGIGKVMLFNGTDYQEINTVIGDEEVRFDLSQAPRSISAEITRDDLKGVKETTTFYVVGPIIFLSK